MESLTIGAVVRRWWMKAAEKGGEGLAEGASSALGGWSAGYGNRFGDKTDDEASGLRLVPSFFDHRHVELSQVVGGERLPSTHVSLRVVRQQRDTPGAEPGLDVVLHLDTHLLMVDDPVKRLESMCMAWGLEARVPFLDRDLVELMAAYPPVLKAGQGGKGLLGEICREVLPAALIDRPKSYVPVAALRHLDEPFLTMVRDALYPPEAKERELLRPQWVARLLARPNGQRTRTGANGLWVLSVLEMWLQQHGVG